MLQKQILFFIVIFILAGVSRSFGSKDNNHHLRQMHSLVSNGSFEEGIGVNPDFWNSSEKKNGEDFVAVWNKERSAKGKSSLYLLVKKYADRSINWSSSEFRVTPGMSLIGEICVEVSITGTSGKQDAGCRGSVFFFDANGKYVRNKQLFFSPANHKWKIFKFSIQVPPTAAKAIVTLGALGVKGEFLFDDLWITEKLSNSNLNNFSLYSPADGMPIIIPQPFYEKYDETSFSWNFEKAAIYAENPNSRAVEELRDVLNASGVKDVMMVSDTKLGDRPLFIFSSLKEVDHKILRSCKLPPEYLKNQSYSLKIELENQIPKFTISGPEQGKYYAVQTIRQYLGKSNSKKKIKTGLIFDKPAYKNRTLISGTHSVSRLDMMKRRKMNMIFLLGSPHSTGWFKGLSNSEIERHKKCLHECYRRYISPVVSVHPGYYRKESDGTTTGKLLRFTDNRLLEGIMDHLENLYNLGYMNFNIAWDDMGRHGGQDKFIFDKDRKAFSSVAQAHRIFTEKIYKRLMTIDPKITLWTIGMSYWLDGSEYEKLYLTEFGKLPEDIRFISCGTMNSKKMAYHKSLTGRGAIVWNNAAGNLNSEFVEPLKLDVSKELETLTDTHMFAFIDKCMIWDIISDYLWRGKINDFTLSAKRSISVMIGAEYAKIIQETAETINKLKNAPISGDTSKERLEAVEKKLQELNEFKLGLRTKVEARIANPFIKEIEELERQLEIYKEEFAQNPLPLKVGYMRNTPSIDGIIETNWGSVTKLSDFRRIMKKSERPELALHQTEAYIGWDEKSLYLAFKCLEPEVSKIKAFVKKRDGTVYHDDCIEIFLDPARTGAHYYQISVNSLGTIYDYFINKEPWNGDIKVQTNIDKGVWTIEMSISFASLNKKVKPGDLWNFNVCRERYADNPEFSSWALLMNRFHEPQHFWTLMFIKETSE